MSRLSNVVVARRRRSLLDSISRLKRATGIADHPHRPDEWVDEKCSIYTIDRTSAEVLAELCYKIYWGDHGSRYYEQPRYKDVKLLKDFIEVKRISDECFETYVPIPKIWIQPFKEEFEKLAKKHIAPTGRSRW